MTSCVAIAQLSAGRKTFKQATSAGARAKKKKKKRSQTVHSAADGYMCTLGA